LQGVSKQVFRIVEGKKIFAKADYKALHKRTLKSHSSVIYSTVNDTVDSIPLVARRKRSFEKSDTLFIIDEFPEEHAVSAETQLLLLNITETASPVSLFKVSKINDEIFFYLNYSENKRKIGEPARDDFFLFKAEQSHPYLFYINGFFDRGAGGNKTRSYVEQVFYIEYLGKKQVELRKTSKDILQVKLDLDAATVIDQRRLFY
jgi:hypothetical protein